MQQKQELLNYFHTLKKHSCLGVGYAFIGEDFSLVYDIVKLISCESDSNFCNSCWDCKRISESNHPDLLVIEPTGLSIKIEAIREAIRFLSMRSFRLKQKAVVIKGAQNLTPQASSAFLKTLEEAPDNSFIALCVSKLDGLTPTISSRCRKIFLPFREQVEGLNGQELIPDFLEGGDIFFKDRKQFSSFLWALISFLHAGLLAKNGSRNNQLSNLDDYAIILKIYSAHKSVNMNLALNLIRSKLGIKMKLR